MRCSQSTIPLRCPGTRSAKPAHTSSLCPSFQGAHTSHCQHCNIDHTIATPARSCHVASTPPHLPNAHRPLCVLLLVPNTTCTTVSVVICTIHRTQEWKRVIREWEEDFEKKTGARPEVSDKQVVRSYYDYYRRLKVLLDAA